MWLFYSVIKEQLALLSLGWVSVKCITHQKTVKRRRFEVNKLIMSPAPVLGMSKPS